jgi:hypothetical protein
MTTGVLLMNAAAAPAPPNISITVRRGARPARRTTLLPKASIVPVLTSAPESTKKAAIVMGAGLAKVAVTRSGVIHPRAIMTPAAKTATVTGGNRSTANATNTETTKARPSSGWYSASVAMMSGP